MSFKVTDVITIIAIKELNILERTSREIPAEIGEEVERYWADLLEKNPGMFNGPVYSVWHMENKDGKVALECELSDYAHYKYSEIHDLGEYACRNMYAGCILVSSDGKLLVSLNGKDSEFVGKIQIIGGAVDPNDRIIGGSFNSEDRWKRHPLSPTVAALRELEEETGEEIRKSITEIGKTYLVTNGKKYGIHTVAYSKLESKEVLSAFEYFKKETGNNEIDKLISFGKEDMEKLKKYDNNQDIGVVDLLKMIFSQMR